MLEKFADNFFVGFSKRSSYIENEAERLHVDHNLGEDGPIDHSSHLSVVDPEGKFVAAMRPPHRSRDLVKALKIVTGK